MWHGLLEISKAAFFLHVKMCVYIAEGIIFALNVAKRMTVYIFHLCACLCSHCYYIIKSVCFITTCRNSCRKVCIGCALKVVETSSGFLRALLDIPLTAQQGLDLSFWSLFSFFFMGINN